MCATAVRLDPDAPNLQPQVLRSCVRACQTIALTPCPPTYTTTALTTSLTPPTYIQNPDTPEYTIPPPIPATPAPRALHPDTQTNLCFLFVRVSEPETPIECKFKPQIPSNPCLLLRQYFLMVSVTLSARVSSRLSGDARHHSGGLPKVNSSLLNLSPEPDIRDDD